MSRHELHDIPAHARAGVRAHLWIAFVMFTCTNFAMSAVRAQSSPLNDTGQTACYQADSTLASNCASADAAMPGQDARFGRDAAQVAGLLPAKTGGGHAGFDFTALDATGVATTTLGSHPCVRDNVTGLIWSTERNILGQTWATASAAAASYSRCGYSNGWRLPTRRELLSIVDYGRGSPNIDVDYFPAITSNYYWTSDVLASDPSFVWLVTFNSGGSDARLKTATYYLRLVRSATP